MSLRRKRFNILLIILSILLGGWAACLYRRPPLVFAPTDNLAETDSLTVDSVLSSESDPPYLQTDLQPADSISSRPRITSDRERIASRVESTRFSDVDTRTMLSDHPFRLEALKILNGHLEEADSVNRHKILSYCEHLRTSYTTRDIDFIRQVFSDNALIIVGHVVRRGENTAAGMSTNDKVRYSIRSKSEYLERLSRIFDSGKDIDIDFSEFSIMRHPTVNGIYGVTLRQKYTCGTYSDDGYLFLLWDFRNPSMPLIHVRTWQPSLSINLGDDELIDISDFNLE